MKYFIELTLIEDSKYSLYEVWSKLYMQVHLAFVEQQNPDETVNFGVSFPDYRFQEECDKSFGYLGDKLRVFASTEQELEQLNLHKWLNRLADYVHIKSIKPVPEKIDSYLQVNRYRSVTNLERLTRRFMQRESKRLGRQLSFEEAQALQNQRFAKEQKVSLQEAEKHYLSPKVKAFPFIKLKSESTQKEFSLQIEQQAVSEKKEGSFSTYGFSSHATVPHW